jgi:hypothetical protein
MSKKRGEKGDKGLMIVSGGIIFIGIIGLFFDTTIGGITLATGLGVLLMAYLSKKP